MEVDSNIITYLAEKALYDFRSNLIPDALADALSKRPWIDAIREKADSSCLDAVKTILQEPERNPGLTHFALNTARGIRSPETISLVRTCFENSESIPNIISSMLLLASYGEMEGKWDVSLSRLASDKEELMQAVMGFYGCDSVEDLRTAIQERQADSKYSQNHPFYEFLLQIIDDSD